MSGKYKPLPSRVLTPEVTAAAREQLSPAERERRRGLFERVSLPTLILRLAAAVEGPQALRKSVENRMSKGGCDGTEG
jgi:hypothetical protein